jgi:3-isopropylmalate/(R)-2-methylmalate dehydratase large subunit
LTAQSGSLFEKIWNRHVVADLGDGFSLLGIDRHIVADWNGNAFKSLVKRGFSVRNPELTFASPDHSVSTDPMVDPKGLANPHVIALRQDTAHHGIRLFDLGEPGSGIVHVITPEMGIAQPGMTICVADSHTCTNGAVGALAWGVGQGEVVHILATQTCIQRKPKSMRLRLEGRPAPGIGGKDLIMHVIGTLGAQAGLGYAVEYAGTAIRNLPMEDRFTLCNMSVEWGARYGLIAPDELTYAYLLGRPYSPKDALWTQAVTDWRTLPSDPDARFDREEILDVSDIAPQVTWGNSLDAVLPVTGQVPDPREERDEVRRRSMEAALEYMALTAGKPIAGTPIDRVFIGSCTNGRIQDLRIAAAIVRGQRVSQRVKAWVVPGSENVKRQAEAEGLDRVFVDAGFEWRLPGCSMCVGGNGDTLKPGERSVSTTNRNFVGRQGPGSRTHVAGPALAAASAIVGAIADPREMGPADARAN